MPDVEKKPIIYRGIKSPLSKEERERLLREHIKDAKPLSQFWDEMRKKHPEKFLDENN